jgi:hypothetical protein
MSNTEQSSERSSETMSMHIEHTDEFGTVRGEPGFIKTWIDVGNQMREEQKRWIAGLRVMGVKAAHPDDGWVNRTKAGRHDYVQFVYPQFDDGVKEGDLIALGWPGEFRVRKVIRIERGGILFPCDHYKVIK